MNNGIYNSSGYPDYTAYEAINNVMREDRLKKTLQDKIVFICSPFAGDVKNNVRNARRYCHYATKIGCIPVAPHLLFPQFLNDNKQEERERGIQCGLALLNISYELWVFGDEYSDGMKREIKAAKARDMKIRYFTHNCKESYHA